MPSTISRNRTYRPRLEALEGRLLPTTYAVVNTANSGAGSLRQAIVNANGNPGQDSIHFNIGGGGPQTIMPASVLPSITDAVTIDATTQPGYAGNPLIELNGSSAGGSYYTGGIHIATANCTIKGLVINRFAGQGIYLAGAVADNNVIQGNYIGTDSTGTIARPNGAYGILVLSGSNNLIGGTTAGARNVISGSTYEGVIITNGASGNIVQGNYIGTDASGTVALGNLYSGIALGSTFLSDNSAVNNLIGGTTAAARNIISANGGAGVVLVGLGTAGNLIQGNYMGTDVTGMQARPNVGGGVVIGSEPTNTTVGGTVAGAGNVLSGNGAGIIIFGSGHLVQGNLIGTDPTGTNAVANGIGAHILFPATNNTIGGTVPAARNLISGNTSHGILIEAGAPGNFIQANWIGVNAAGLQALGNGTDGIRIVSANNTVGGTAAGSGNVISGNGSNGIYLASGATGNVMQGNYIGTDATGGGDLGNGADGISIASPSNTVGGTLGGAGNVISGNGLAGVHISTAAAIGNQVLGNRIGTNAAGIKKVPNNTGVLIDQSANNNTIGGTVLAARNLISGNATFGVAVHTTGNLIQGNYIGTDITGTLARSNVLDGIFIQAANNTVGGTTAAARNTIAFNSAGGIRVDGAAGNLIRQNSIHTNADLGIIMTNSGNNNQNAPSVNSATSSSGGTTVSVSLALSAPSTVFTIEFFSSSLCDPSTFGEGETYLGSKTLTTKETGRGRTIFVTGVEVPTGHVITATATSPGNDTSKFGKCRTVTASAAPGGNGEARIRD